MKVESKNREIINSSPKALALCEASQIGQGERQTNHQNGKYPFGLLLVGESFTVPFVEANPGTLASLRSSASRYAKLFNCKFRVLIHNEFQCVEVARIA